MLMLFLGFIFTVVFPLLFLGVFISVTCASFDTDIGIRRAYVRFLLRAFEECAQLIKRDTEKRRKESLTYVPDENEDKTDTIQCPPISDLSIIKREASERIGAKLKTGTFEAQGDAVRTVVADNLDFIKAGMEAIMEDQVTSRFVAEELPTWNLLTRTSSPFKHVNWKLDLIWFGGFFIRYFILLPGRLVILIIGLVLMLIGTSLVGYVKNQKWRQWLNFHMSTICNRIMSHSVSAVLTYHNPENKAQCGGICVANHTSPIDVIMLACDCCFALIGQKQGGLLGVVQRAQSRASDHIWFERSEAKDRNAVLSRIKNHVEDGKKCPILIFPEGTCINNTSVMMFKKGSFEVGTTIYPVALKYDSRFGDPFWNSSEQGFFEYMLRMMTSWAIVADVWYLPPLEKKPEEDAIAFANRVKKMISEAGGLVDLEWDGQLKRYPVSEKMKAKQQELYSHRIQSVEEKKEPSDFL